MSRWSIILSAACLLLSGLALIWNHRRTKRILDTIERMLEEAAKGDYTETAFDESRLSSLETRFSDYLAASAISARNIAAEKDKIKTLISDISHQTKTPIANLLLYSELLEEEELPDTARDNVEALRIQAEKLRFLIDTLVKLSRLENGILTLVPRPEPVRPMLLAVLEQFLPRAEQRGLRLSLEDGDAFASFDPKWTLEALGNLVDNAIKYTSQGGVTLSAVSYQMFTRIDVTDTGAGIPEEEQAKVFSRFYRCENARSSEGVGIGLYLAREIISGQGGYIRLTSLPGQGSTFSVFLPK